MTQRALVLGAGGYAASAWEIGIVAGLADGGVHLREADLMVGTSAGARVAVELAGSASTQELVRLTLAESAAPAPDIDLQDWSLQVANAKASGGGLPEVLRRVSSGASGRRGPIRQAAISASIRVSSWPDRRVLIVAVEAESGTRRAFDHHSGIGLIDAVTASGALAGVWPPVLFEGRHYVDGGFYSTDNADLAAGADRVLILALREREPRFGMVSIEDTVAILGRRGASTEIVHPDEAMEQILESRGGDVLDPGICGPALRAGRAQGARLARTALARWWRQRPRPLRVVADPLPA